MKWFRVFGHTQVGVVVTVRAENEAAAIEKAGEQLEALTAYCGNGGSDKLIGVDGEHQSIFADDEIVYDDTMELPPNLSAMYEDDEEEEE